MTQPLKLFLLKGTVHPTIRIPFFFIPAIFHLDWFCVSFGDVDQRHVGHQPVELEGTHGDTVDGSSLDRD